jgi:rod shape-determining protein MreC
LKGVTRFRKIWIWFFLIGFVLFLVSSNSGQRLSWNPAEQLLIEITAPFQKFIEYTVNVTKAFWLNYFYLVNVQRENRDLSRKMNALKMENAEYSERLATHERIYKLLRFKQTINHPAVAAQVIGLDPSGWFKSVIIDKGKNAGIRTDLPVVNQSGVVGRVVSVSPNYAKVLLIIDQNSAVDCLMKRSRDRGLLKGSSSEICKLDYVGKSCNIKVGDMAITSGLGGVFPKGLPVGQILRVRDFPEGLFKDIDVNPTVNFSKLEEVLVVLKENHPSKLHKEEK